jgi:hypothetical protein
MNAYVGVDVLIHILLTSILTGGEWSASRRRRFTPGERDPGNRWIGSWVDLRAGLDDLVKREFLTLQGLELRLLGRPARSQSLYRLSYPGSYEGSKEEYKNNNHKGRQRVKGASGRFENEFIMNII